uniref:Uncharacterized protein n=1 Tax=Rhipicephalus appendiculatus TaxID=34631 RepID=A0A131YC42_RHIAP
MRTRHGSCAPSHAPVIFVPNGNEKRMQPNILLVITSAVPLSWSSCMCYNVLLRQIMSLFLYYYYYPYFFFLIIVGSRAVSCYRLLICC